MANPFIQYKIKTAMPTRRQFLQSGTIAAAGALMINKTFADNTPSFIEPNIMLNDWSGERTDLYARQRAIHLDFHTSPYIDNVGTNFNATDFVKTLKEAHVNSINVFAKCHHGMSYYPTRIGKIHPGLKNKDLLGEMLEALHKENFRVPIYTPIGWEEHVADTHPEWRQLKKDGAFASLTTGADPGAVQQAPWRYNDFANPDYQDYIEAHLNELLSNYEVDGLWIDILFYHPEGGWSDAAIKFREKHGLLKDTAANHQYFEMLVQEQFTKRFTQQIKAKAPHASVFYNTPNNMYIGGNDGVLKRAVHQTHFEIESLPSGIWGYYHFPRLARRLAHKGKYWLGMTGKFQKMWGDFGGIKPQAALEYECFRSQALGGGNSVGDQLHPRGMMDKETYQVIGAVYAQTAAAEPFYNNSAAIPQVGILCPNYPGFNEQETAKSEEGAVLMMEELHYDCALLDDNSDLTGFDLIILPDTVVLTDVLKAKVTEQISKGGKLFITYQSGFNAAGNWALDTIPLQFEGMVDAYPTFWKPIAELNHARSERVFYQQGLKVKPGPGFTVWVDRVVPYFKRSDIKFCSHFQTPPDAIDTRYPAIMGNKQIVYFADPVFKEYRQSGNVFIKETVQQLIERSFGKPLAGWGLPPSILVVPRKRKNDLIITLLNYVPVRKSLDIDLVLPARAKEVFCITTGKKLLKNRKGNFDLPALKGRLLLEVKNYFS
jgi:Hypothetical glycosyl hydrolase 6